MQQQFHDVITAASAVVSLWQQFNEPRAAVVKTLTNVTPVSERPLTFETLADARHALDDLKTAELDLHGQQRHFDYFSNRGKQLLQDSKALPGFDRQQLTDDIVTLSARWSKCQTVRRPHELLHNASSMLLLLFICMYTSATFLSLSKICPRPFQIVLMYCSCGNVTNQ